MRKKLRKQAGFTLIEILVTISVMVMLMSVTTINFRSSEKGELARLSARRIGDALQHIETYAQSSTNNPAYATAKSFGVHIEMTAPQKILTFADITTPLVDGKPFVGHWDVNTADVQIGDALRIDVTGQGSILLDKITVSYKPNDTAAQNPGCAKDSNGGCIKDSSGYYVSTVSSIDIAAKPPSVRFVVSGGSDFPAHPSGIAVRQVTFDVKQKNTDKHKLVTLNLLSGRIDVEY